MTVDVRCEHFGHRRYHQIPDGTKHLAQAVAARCFRKDDYYVLGTPELQRLGLSAPAPQNQSTEAEQDARDTILAELAAELFRHTGIEWGIWMVLDPSDQGLRYVVVRGGANGVNEPERLRPRPGIRVDAIAHVHPNGAAFPSAPLTAAAKNTLDDCSSVRQTRDNARRLGFYPDADDFIVAPYNEDLFRLVKYTVDAPNARAATATAQPPKAATALAASPRRPALRAPTQPSAPRPTPPHRLRPPAASALAAQIARRSPPPYPPNAPNARWSNRKALPKIEVPHPSIPFDRAENLAKFRAIDPAWDKELNGSGASAFIGQKVRCTVLSPATEAYVTNAPSWLDRPGHRGWDISVKKGPLDLKTPDHWTGPTEIRLNASSGYILLNRDTGEWMDISHVRLDAPNGTSITTSDEAEGVILVSGPGIRFGKIRPAYHGPHLHISFGILSLAPELAAIAKTAGIDPSIFAARPK